MKNLKHFVSILLVLALALAMAVPAFAETETGSITIENINPGAVYKIYKILDLESYVEGGAYSYKVTAAWAAFFETPQAKNYFAVDNGYATWVAEDDDDATVAAFAQLALAYAKATASITPTKTSATEGAFVLSADGKNGTFSGLDLGYYLVDSNAGALCGLTTNDPDAEIAVKNGIPTLTKDVQEDSKVGADDEFGDTNTADIGQTVKFRAVVDVAAGAEGYVVHDWMCDALNFTEVTEILHVTSANSAGTKLVAADYNVVTQGLSDGCTFHVVFTAAGMAKFGDGDQLVLYYTAVLNEDAVIAGDGNPNKARLEYGEKINGEGIFTPWDNTVTYTYAFDLVKTDKEHKLLDGAEFLLYDAATEGNVIPVVLGEDGETYRLAMEGEEGVSIVVTDGMVRIQGLDSDTYYLEETVVPEGYNRLPQRHAFTIEGENLDATVEDGYIAEESSGVHIINKSGTVLPETGGVGTTLFYVIGGILVLAAVVLLVTKKRMNTKA